MFDTKNPELVFQDNLGGRGGWGGGRGFQKGGATCIPMADSC